MFCYCNEKKIFLLKIVKILVKNFCFLVVLFYIGYINIKDELDVCIYL